MPLRDHFNGPLCDRWPWDGIHASWACNIVGALNGDCLPQDYRALPLIKREKPPDVPHDIFEIQVFEHSGGMRLCAAIELVSPANKDRPNSRRAFALKCASYLQQRISVVVIDVVTAHVANLHAEVLGLLDVRGEAWQAPTQLSAITYRIAVHQGKSSLEMWTKPLTVGAPLPTMPLWLEHDSAVPLRLEESYQAMCTSLRMS